MEKFTKPIFELAKGMRYLIDQVMASGKADAVGPQVLQELVEDLFGSLSFCHETVKLKLEFFFLTFEVMESKRLENRSSVLIYYGTSIIASKDFNGAGCI